MWQENLKDACNNQENNNQKNNIQENKNQENNLENLEDAHNNPAPVACSDRLLRHCLASGESIPAFECSAVIKAHHENVLKRRRKNNVKVQLKGKEVRKKSC